MNIKYNIKEIEEKLKYLRWFYNNPDFGPIHDNKMKMYQDKYEQDTGNKVPEYYDYRTNKDDDGE